MKDHVVVMFLQIDIMQKLASTSELGKKGGSYELAGLHE